MAKKRTEPTKLQRILALGIEQASSNHQNVVGSGKGTGHRLKLYGPGGGGFKTCPHPDCLAARVVARNQRKSAG